jgi:hypothetical protein
MRGGWDSGAVRARAIGQEQGGLNEKARQRKELQREKDSVVYRCGSLLACTLALSLGFARDDFDVRRVEAAFGARKFGILEL